MDAAQCIAVQNTCSALETCPDEAAVSDFTPSLLGPLLSREPLPAREQDFAFVRLWRGFMTARIVMAAVLLALQLAGFPSTQTQQPWLVFICVVYLGTTAAARWLTTPVPPGKSFDRQWIWTIGVDMLAFWGLQFFQVGGLNYTPLFAVPVLFASVMGSFLLAIAAAAAATLILLADAWWYSLNTLGETASRFLQAGLTGVGFFVVSFLANQLAARLVREERVARMSQLAARSQVQVNEVIIEAMSDGVLVVDAACLVRAANPAARRLLAGIAPCPAAPFLMETERAWQPLTTVVRDAFGLGQPVVREVKIAFDAEVPRSVHVRASVTQTRDTGGDQLCVMFVQDLREMEARVRTEKLAAMGRMSAAIAHEIRNPLSAISQANALLAEDLSDPAQKKLTDMVRSNAKRLDKIVEDVLNLARVREVASETAENLALDGAVQGICHDWATQAAEGGRLALELKAPEIQVNFDPEHLRRVLINLLDNAARYASTARGAIKVKTRHTRGLTTLAVWSDGATIETAVRDRLFEPFFSSESRSSGLGLYICRELCERHAATLGYRRRESQGQSGNEFLVTFPPAVQQLREPAEQETRF
jgi:two-component system, NtrC family, sensor histidine kinase PilS